MGFTLIELVFYLAIASIILLSVGSLFRTMSELRLKNQVIITVEEEGRQAMDYILKSIRSATSVSSPIPNNNSPSLTLNINGVINIFDISTNRLRLTEGASQPIFITSDKTTVSDLTFQNLANTSTKDNIGVQFTLTYINNTSRPEYNYAKIFNGASGRR